jgi:FG-GAP repeat
MRRLSVAFLLLLASVVAPAGVVLTHAATTGRAAAAAPLHADFDGDGNEDVAVGAPGEVLGAAVDAGAVNVLYGADAGLSGTGSQLFSQDTAGVGGSAEEFDRFGSAVAAGDFDGDGFDDLAVGAPGEAVGTVDGAGAVTVLFGSATGLTGTGSQLFTQANLGGGGTSGQFESFGQALATGDLDGDGIDDLAIGVPFGNAETGSVHVLFGTAGGLTGGRPTVTFTQDSPGVGGAAESFDQFGGALATGDFDNSGVTDLAIGSPGEATTVAFAGAVHILFGQTTGITGTGSQLFVQDTPGVPSDSEEGDGFGSSFGAGDFDADGVADLAIGAPFETVGAVQGAGAAFVLYGATGGLTVTGAQVFHQGVAGIGGEPEVIDGFAFSLAAGDFDNDDDIDDLAVGVPFEEVGNVLQAGAINILFGSGGGLTGAGSQLFTQDVAGMGGTVEEFDLLGWALAVADVQGDEFDDLVAGAAFESIGNQVGAGAINFLPGTATGLRGGPVLHQDVAGIAGTAEEFDQFGFALAASNPNDSGTTGTASESEAEARIPDRVSP